MARSSNQSLAAYYRAHRKAFDLAMELDCTPREAEAELERRAARDRWQGTKARLQATLAAPLPATTSMARAGHDPDEEPRPQWWQGD